MKQVENQYKCIPFWSWNDDLDPQELLKQIARLKQDGAGGFFMHARGGLKTEYLGEKWFECVRACAEKAKKEGMSAYVYDENGWPSGFAGGALLEDEHNRDMYLEVKRGAFDAEAFASFAERGDRLERVFSARQAESAGKEKENLINVYARRSVSTADILNAETVEKFIALTHEQYKKRDREKLLAGFFTDEPQYFRNATPYTEVLEKYFKEYYGEDLRDGIGLLFFEKKGYRSFRYKYWRALQTLLIENYAKKIYEWCEKNGYKLTGHFAEEDSCFTQMTCCAGIMPLYEYEHIPGIDCLGRRLKNEIAPKQLGSVCAQLGKKQALTETFALCGWDVTPRELKRIAESQYVAGVNLMCQHLYPYSEHGQRKRDYPAHFSASNPWAGAALKNFNDYFSVVGKILSESKEIVNVAVLHPLRSVYFDYKRYENGGAVKEIDDKFAALCKKLCDMQIPHHFLDETLLKKYGKVENGRLLMGKCAYDFVVFPKILTMDRSTEKLIREFVLSGGKVLLTDEKPRYLEGEPFEYEYLRCNTDFEAMKKAQAFTANENEYVRSAVRVDESGRKFIYAVNLGEECEMRFSGAEFSSFEEYSVETDEYAAVPANVKFRAWESKILYFSRAAAREKTRLATVYPGEEFEVCGDPENLYTLDFLQYSEDGVNYGEPVYHLGAFYELLKKRYSGKIYLRYAFRSAFAPKKILLTLENGGNEFSVSVNGVSLKSGVRGTGARLGFIDYDIAGLVKKGENFIDVAMDFHESEKTYYALFGNGVTESLKNCIAYESEIEPAYLKGDFGVYGDFVPGKTEKILLGKNFELRERKTKVRSLIEDGYPFFSGTIRLEQTLQIEDPCCELSFQGRRFHFIEAELNGKPAGKTMFSETIELSSVAEKGENRLALTVTTGLRNTFGPFHTAEQENIHVEPNTFERFGQWKNGKCASLKDEYAFVKNFI